MKSELLKLLIGNHKKRKKTEPTATKGRPVKNTTPEPIPGTMEHTARTLMQGPPKKDWDYLKATENGG